MFAIWRNFVYERKQKKAELRAAGLAHMNAVMEDIANRIEENARMMAKEDLVKMMSALAVVSRYDYMTFYFLLFHFYSFKR